MKVGDIINYFTILQVVGSKKSHCVVRCVCGITKEVDRSQVNLGRTKSCGCLRSKMISDAVKTHGKSKSKLYDVYIKMVERCSNTFDKGYQNYGGRGITVCDSWKESFENFYKDMGQPLSNQSLDRRDNDLGYSKENCRWVDRTIQNANRRKLNSTRKTTSECRCVHKAGDGWRTTIYRYGKVVYDKYSKTEEAAIRNYEENIGRFAS